MEPKDKLIIEREKIDKIDLELAKLLDLRFERVHEILEIKKQQGMPVFHPGREKEIIEQVSSKSKNPEFIAEIFKKIMQESRKFQEALR